VLDFRKVGEDLDGYKAKLGRRPKFDAALLEPVRAMSLERSQAITRKQSLEAQKNAQNDDMKRIFKSGTNEEKAAAREAQKKLSDEIKTLDARVVELETALEAKMLDIPNVPHDSVPIGDESANEYVREWGKKPAFSFKPRDHVEIGQDVLKMLEFERATKISGPRFTIEYGDLARMERALVSFMIDVHTQENGYREIAVPYLVNSDSLIGTGQLPKFAEEQFRVPFQEERDYWLVPTAEVPVTNLYRDEIIGPELGSMPHAFCCYTACFRKEAGAAGRDTRGLIRQHQFNKVELVRFVEPDKSYEELELLTSHAESILQKLGLHYRVMLLASGDMSSNAAKGYDLEVWLPGQDTYREISSCSNFEDFQARRAKIRYRTEPKGKPQLVHTLNGSGLAIGRTLIAILEQYQQEDGSVVLPEALRPYMFGKAKLTPA
jgi:seryl-tRNA synthetase